MGAPPESALHDCESNAPAGPRERVWAVVAAIPRGRVATYGQVAELAGLPRGARLVGRILSRLPAGTRLPWHRVINAAGAVSLPGSAGARQRALLEAEGVPFARGRVDLGRVGWGP